MVAERMASLFQIRSDEGRLVRLVAALFAFLEIGRNLGANAADGLFLIRFGAEYLPYMTIALGAITFLVTLSYTIGLGRAKKSQFFVGVLGVFALVLLLERAALLLDWAPLYPILWLTINIISAVLGTLMWNIAAEVCDARQAKRLFSLFTSAGIFGGIVGNLVTGALAKALGTENLLLLCVVLLSLAAALARRVAVQYFRPAPIRDSGSNWLGDLRVGFDFVRSSPLMLMIAYSSILFSILYYSVYIPYSQIVSASIPNVADLAGFLGLVSTGITVLTFLVSLFVANRLFARIGIVNAILLLPAAYLAGFALFSVNATLATAVVVRVSQMVFLAGLSNAAWGSLFNVVPADIRGQVQSFDGGVTSQIGVMLSGVLPLVAVRFLTTSQIFLIGIATSIATGYLVWRMRADYGRALVDALRAGLVDVFTATHRGFQSFQADASARQTLLDGLADPQATRRVLAVQVLGRVQDRRAAGRLIEMLADPDVSVRRAILVALVQLDARDAADAVARCIGDGDPSVRAAAIDTLSALSPSRPEFPTALRDTDPIVRSRAAVALNKMGEAAAASNACAALIYSKDARARAAGLDAVADCRAGAPFELVSELTHDPAPRVRLAAVRAMGALDDPRSTDALTQLLDDPDERTRASAAACLQRSQPDLKTILGVLTSGSERAQEAALTVLSGRGAESQKAVGEWARGQVPRAAQFRDWASRLGGTDRSESRGIVLLLDLLRAKEWQTERRILQGVALIGPAESIKLIARGLRSQDQQVRAQALEALDTLGDKQIARALVPLLEQGAPASGRHDVRAVLEELSRHSDPWLRAFAVRALTRSLAHDWQAVVARARDDTDPLVRQAACDAMDAKEGDMTETLNTLGTMDRILFLRQVPLFGDLAPEDLEQIAAVATERAFSPNDYLCREGEIGDELLVIVEGQVRVTKGANGSERTLRTLQAGEHIGELAILREQPRSASVVADGGSVRTLVIRGAELKAILRDRPEVAMAMLGSLAQRMSTLA